MPFSLHDTEMGFVCFLYVARTAAEMLRLPRPLNSFFRKCDSIVGD